MITRSQLADALFWEQTICVACGATEGEPNFPCFECDGAIVLPARLVTDVVAQVEEKEDES